MTPRKLDSLRTVLVYQLVKNYFHSIIFSKRQLTNSTHNFVNRRIWRDTFKLIYYPFG